MTYEGTTDPEIKLDSRTGIYYYRGTPRRGGKEIKKSLGVRTFRAAQLAKKDFLLKSRGAESGKDIAFKDYVLVFLEERKKKAQATYESAFYSCQQLLRFFESHMVSQITDATWDEYVSYQHQMNPGRLLRYDRRHLKMILLRCKKKGHISEMPELELDEAGPKTKRTLTQAEIDAILTNATGVLAGLALFMYKMGPRPGEVLGAQWSEFDLENGIWTLPASRVKTRQSRTMKLNPAVLDYLRDVSGGRYSDFVFPTRENPAVPVHRYNKQWGRLMRQCGLDPTITPYLLRHTFLTECAKKVRDGKLGLVLVTKYAGTSIDEFERTYLHVGGEDTKSVSTLMDEGPLDV
jgi:integrase